MHIKIQNISQLELLVSQCLNSHILPIYSFTKELTLSFDFLQEIKELKNKSFSMVMMPSKRPRFFDFEDEDGNLSFFFDIKNEEIVVCKKDANINANYDISFENKKTNLSKKFVQFPKKMMESVIEEDYAKGVFLTLCGFDNSNGFFSEDYENYKEEFKNMHQAVFGYK